MTHETLGYYDSFVNLLHLSKRVNMYDISLITPRTWPGRTKLIRAQGYGVAAQRYEQEIHHG